MASESWALGLLELITVINSSANGQGLDLAEMRPFRWRRGAESRSDPSPSDYSATSCSSSSSSSSRTIFPSGIKQLHCPLKSTVDIVFIHGLTGDRERTWTVEGASEPWPKTLLPSKLPTARILTFGYDAYVADWKSVVSQNRIANHAYNLLTSLAHYRDDDNTNEHPIIFVCHSLGGLICQDALNTARQRTERHLQAIFRSARGIIFLGTPHHGAGLAVWAERLSRYIGVVKQMNSKILEVLRADSEVLARVQDGFHTMVRARSQEGYQPIEISCFYEELPLQGVGLVVPQDSAIIPGYIPIGIHSNHMDMGKFATADDPGFVSIYGELRRWVREMGKTGLAQENSSASDSVRESQTAPGEQNRDEIPTSQFIVPYPNNSQFVGRSEILERLKSQLGHQAPCTNDQTHRRLALCGLGGIGKTQIALAYVFWLRKTSPDVSIYWVHASSVERFRQAYAEIAEVCQIPGYDDPKADILSLLKRWLEHKNGGRWFMVIDNADNAELFCRPTEPADTVGEKYLGQYIPESAHGTVLVTTRNKQLGLRLVEGIRTRLIEVGKMGDVDCCELLRTWLDPSLVAAEKLSILASRLEQLPLALAQAAGFIQENTINLDSYLHLLDQGDQSFIGLLSEEFATVGRDSGMPHAVAATWMLSFEQIERHNPLAGQLLLFMSLFDRQAIPMEFLSHFSHFHPNCTQLQLTKALGILKAFSLITEENGQSLYMHRLVQLVTQKWLSRKGIMTQFVEKALLTVSRYYPYGSFETREKCATYLPHVQAVLKLDGTKSRDEDIARASLLHCTAALFSLRGQLDLAEEVQIRATEILERVLGPTHPNTLTSMNNLAGIYNEQAQLDKAKSLCAKVMEIRKTVLGPEHPETLQSMSILSTIHWGQGQWKEAESLEMQAMEIRKTVLGPEHPDMLQAMANLATVYYSQDRWKEAQSLLAQVLGVEKTVFGPEHPVTLNTMSNLASTYYRQGQQEEAESFSRQALEAQRAVLGPNHPDTIRSVSNLGSVYAAQGRWKEAESLALQALEWRKTVLGPNHPDTAFSMSRLAQAWESQGRIDEALQLMEDCVQVRSRVLGLDHPTMAESIAAVDRLRGEAGRRTE
ncbi:hypothetical protein NUW58_g6735 [Xylaria curta]|uniref:Uncharacterized protein n=1 Tax=Xylaria curta TaxID=42375 RepID=A0ACC1NQ61_9PEZI|nr:hypothetical protein NUW58_g6735 [Xylaria curta]